VPHDWGSRGASLTRLARTSGSRPQNARSSSSSSAVLVTPERFVLAAVAGPVFTSAARVA
jgi:hypothetical protein